MNRLHHSKDSRAGGILAIALIMTMLGGIIMASWMTIGFARTLQASHAEQAVKRRLSLGNSKALARQYALERVFQSGSSEMANISDSLGAGAWGSLNTGTGFVNTQPFGLYPNTAYPAAGYYDTLFPFNNAGLRAGASFMSLQHVTKSPSDLGIDAYNAYLFIRAASPLATGDGLTVYRKPTGETAEIVLDGNFQVNGRLVVRDPRSFFPLTRVDRSQKVRVATRARSFYIQKHDPLNLMTGTNLSNAEIASSNLSAVPSTFGYTDSAQLSSAYTAELNVINNGGNPANSLYHRQEDEFLSGTTALLNLNSPYSYGTAADPVQVIQYTVAMVAAGNNPPVAYRPPGWPSGYGDWSIAYIRLGHAALPNIRITPAINQVVFEGQASKAAYDAAANMDPRIILILSDGSPFPRQFYFGQENARPAIVGVRSTNRSSLELRWVGPGTPAVPNALTLDWRLYFINEGRHNMVYIPGSSLKVGLTGGIMTNWSFERADAGGSDFFTITPVWNPPYRLASLLPREGWLETYFTLTDP